MVIMHLIIPCPFIADKYVSNISDSLMILAPTPTNTCCDSTPEI